MSDYAEMAEALEQSRNMPDPVDRASGIEILERISGVAAVREKLQGQGAEECEECGIEIPAARRKAYPSAVCCVECQSLREVRRG
jgi:phage/conjugal plasmid C-4 type zinc finger TraR family protein